jgi:hypothetical protein
MVAEGILIRVDNPLWAVDYGFCLADPRFIENLRNPSRLGRPL